MARRRLKLIFGPALVKEPVIYQLGRKFEIVTNIRRADVTRDQGWVLLEDDKHLQLADNVIPIIRDKAANDEVTRILNGVSAKLTTEDLIKLNQSVDVDKQDPPAAAEKWLKDKGLIKK